MAAKKMLNDLDMNGNAILNAVISALVATPNIITSNTTVPANSSMIVRGRLLVNSGIRLIPALGASVLVI